MRPFLTTYEVEIPNSPGTEGTQYDESQMILLVEGKPALFEKTRDFPFMTKHTMRPRETTDDD